jgi:hypothetical protein
MKKLCAISMLSLFIQVMLTAQVAHPGAATNATTPGNTFLGVGPVVGAAGGNPIATGHFNGTAINDINGERILHLTLSDNATNFMQVSNGASANTLFSPLLWTNKGDAGPSMHIMANIAPALDVNTDNSALMIFGTRSAYNSNPVNAGNLVTNRPLFEWRNGPNNVLMRLYNGNLGLGTGITAPTAQLHTTGSVRFQGLTAFAGTPNRTIVSDLSGNLFFVNGAPALLTCNTVGTIPVVGAGGTLGCSIIQQNTSLANCGAGTHPGVGIGGAPIATAISGATCYNLGLTVYGSGLASSGLWIASDKKFKTNVKQLNYGLSEILRLNPVTYEFKTSEFPEMNFSTGSNLGFIAQEIEQVIPEVVGNTEKDFKIVNYDQMVPVMVNAMQEQQKMIQDLMDKLVVLEKELNALKNQSVQPATGSLQLKDAVPNPFHDRTVIQVEIPNGAHRASVQLYNAAGQLVGTYPVDSKGKSQIEISGASFSAGQYTYMLLVDGKLVQSKKLIKQ